MNNDNAPFYEGQKIVRTGRSVPPIIIHGNTYTAAKCERCNCGKWHVYIAELPTSHPLAIPDCCGTILPAHPYMSGNANYFAPLNPYSSDATKELIENIQIGDGVDQPVKVVVNN